MMSGQAATHEIGRRRRARLAVVTMVMALAGQLGSAPEAAGPPLPQPAAAAVPQNTSAAAAPGLASQPRALLDKYCVTCHNERLRTASLTLDRADISQIGAAPELWEKVLRKLNTGAMPPAGAPRPDAAASGAFVSWLDGELLRAAAAHPQPGRPTLHRLNRAEYGNAIRDLLAIEIDSRSLLPADDSGYGFDNIGDVLSVSPGLLERYMNAARRISRMAVGDPGMRPALQTYSAPKYLVQDDRVDERLPFGSRGGIAIPHFFPLDGEYTLKVRLQRTWRVEIRGLASGSYTHQTLPTTLEV
jgi:cytochrome c5